MSHFIYKTFGVGGCVGRGVGGGAGRAVSEYLRTNLHRNVEKVLKEAGGHGVEECLKASFLLTGAVAAFA